MINRILIIGAGLAGASIAHLLKKDGCLIEVWEKNKILGGLCADDKWEDYYVSKFGAHIIRFDNSIDGIEAKSFVERFCNLIPFNHKVVAVGNGVLSYFPINDNYKKLFRILSPNKDIFNEYIVSYSKKMWGKHYKNVLPQIKERFKFKKENDNLFINQKLMYIPKEGYSNMIKNMLKGINVLYSLKTTKKHINFKKWNKIIVTSPIDEFFGYKYGKLDYRGLFFTFKTFTNISGPLLPSPVVNLNTNDMYIRMVEHGQFYNSKSAFKVISFEKPNDRDKMYPVLTKKNLNMLQKYKKEALKYPNLYFLGRLGEYKYYDMDAVVIQAIKLYNTMKGGNSKNDRTD